MSSLRNYKIFAKFSVTVSHSGLTEGAGSALGANLTSRVDMCQFQLEPLFGSIWDSLELTSVPESTCVNFLPWLNPIQLFFGVHN
jgi:hypothetical protein